MITKVFMEEKLLWLFFSLKYRLLYSVVYIKLDLSTVMLLNFC